MLEGKLVSRATPTNLVRCLEVRRRTTVAATPPRCGASSRCITPSSKDNMTSARNRFIAGLGRVVANLTGQ